MKIILPNYMRREDGQILAFALILLSIIILMMSALFAYTDSQIVAHRHAVNKEQALSITEGGVEMALWKLNNQSGYAGETNTPLGNGTFTVSVDTINSGQKNITVTGYIPNSTNPVVHRTVKITADIGSDVAFHYGVQSGNGGFSMSGSNTTVNGNVYANGNISGNGSITGSAVAANLPQVVADQTNDSPMPPTNSITFGNASATEDFAQSFMLSQSYSFNSIQLYIKKISTPSNATIRILYDNNGVPGTAMSGMTGTLNAALVTTNYGWVTVTMPTSPILNAGQLYWLVIDASSSSSKYYILGANPNGYLSGTGKIGKYNSSWNNTSPAGLDGYFRIYLGGATSTISGINIGTSSSDVAWAHTVSQTTVSGTIYCQSGSGNNKSCNTSRPDPDPQALPVSDGNIQDWKNEAAVGQPIAGDYSLPSNVSLGPKEIDGNLTISGKTLTVTGTLWVKGNINLSGGGTIQLDAGYGSHNGVIVTDGWVDLSGGSNFYGSGQPGSYPFLITTSSCPDGPTCSNKPAINFGGGSGTVGLVAQNGTIAISGGSALKAVAAKTISMSGGSQLIYDSGLVNANFTSGPGGSWNFMPGSYVISQ